jgi:tetraacyldisaccharide-1-P 4'-kinase
VGVAAGEVLAFRDHHRYRDLDVHAIRERAGNRGIVTTEKDWVKLSRFAWGDCPVWIARLDVDLVGADDVDAWLLS